MNESQKDARLQALTVELVSSAPLAPPMPDLDAPPQTNRWRGPTLAIAVALIAIAIPLLTVTLWTSMSARDTPPAADDAAVFRASGATPVALVAEDDTVLRGYLWEGGPRGVVLNQGFGSDAKEIIRLATAAHDEGAAVLLFESRGQGASEGSADPSMLGADLEAAVKDLTTRGAESVTIVSFRHSATAAIALAADPPDTVKDVVAIFPFERYQNLNALDFIGSAKIPIMLIGTSYPSASGPDILALTAEASDRFVSSELFNFVGDDISLLDAHMDRLVEIIRERAR